MSFAQTVTALAVLFNTLRQRPSGRTASAAAVQHLRRTVFSGRPLDARHAHAMPCASPSSAAVTGAAAAAAPTTGATTTAERQCSVAANDFGLSYLASTPPQPIRTILIHGTPGAADGWADYVLSRPVGVQVIAVDRAGFGQSGPNGAIVSLALQAQAVARVIAEASGPVVVVGHSLGGAVAARLAADYPQHVAALVLVAASLDPAIERVHVAQRFAALRCVSWALPRAVRNANTELMALQGELEALASRLGCIKAPTFILHGSHDPLVPVENVEFMRRNITRAGILHINILPNKNHFLPWNAVAALRDTLDLAIAAARASASATATSASEAPL